MNYFKKSLKLHGGKDIFILSPEHENTYLTAIEDKDYYFTLSNSTGYAYLRDILLSTCALKENEVIYVPLNFKYMDEYHKSYLENQTHYKGMIFMNYKAARFKAKDIITAINVQRYDEEMVKRVQKLPERLVEAWKTNERLTVKPFGKYLIFSSSKDVFTAMAMSCQRMTEYNDLEEYNDFRPHFHHDMQENTKKSVGITFCYWTPPRKRKAMSCREFASQFRRGIGSAIAMLENNQDEKRKAKYSEIVLRYCLKDISYDPQSEGTKGQYLYTAIRSLKGMNSFFDAIADAYMKRLPSRLSEQLTDLLQAFALDGSEKAEKTLLSKYEQLKGVLLKRKTFSFRYCEREQFEYLMIIQMQRGSFHDFKRIVEDAGSIILSRGDDLCSEYSWFLSCAEDRFGKEKILKFFEEESLISGNVKAFADGFSQAELTCFEYQADQKSEKATLNGLIERLYPIASNVGFYENIGYYIRFGREAPLEELLKLAKYIDKVSESDAKAKLLKVFSHADYPLDISQLLLYATSENKLLKKSALSAFKRLKDTRIHDLAIRFLECGDAEAALPLLKENWGKSDDALIKKAVLKSKRVTHSMQMDLLDIYEKHKSSSCGDILLHAYRNGECSYCRYGIVKAMGKNKVLTDDILQECLYDSYYDTRAYAEEIYKKRYSPNAGRSE